MAWTLLPVSRLSCAARRSPRRIWNARFQISASPRSAMHSALQHPQHNCSAALDFTPWAWQIIHGVDVVVGSHPHCVQSLDFYHGRPIAYSLGNLVFDGAPTVASWNRGALLKVGLNEDAKISSASLIAVILQDGLPHMDVTESDRFGSR